MQWNASPYSPPINARGPTTSSMAWVRTDLASHEREDLLAALTSEQRRICARATTSGFLVWESSGIPCDGPLRRSRFTHSTHFATRRGEFVVDAEGSVRKRSIPREGNALALLE